MKKISDERQSDQDVMILPRVQTEASLSGVSLLPAFAKRFCRCSHRLSIRVVALCLVFCLVWHQTVWCDGLPSQDYDLTAVRPVVAAANVSSTAPDEPVLADATTQFLANNAGPLSESPGTDQNIYDESGRIVTEKLPDGRMFRHVYEGQSIQSAIDNAEAGTTLFIHSGTYHYERDAFGCPQGLILKAGVNLQGENADTTILHGDYETGIQGIRAMGNNRIEGLTISGIGPYAGTPSAAIRVEGDRVVIRHNRIVANKDYGIHVRNGSDTLIEMNYFSMTHVGVQLPKDTTVIRYNTFVANDIAINVLSGAKSRICNNIFTGSTFSSIYEFSWAAHSAGQPGRGYAVVENNTFWKNTERSTAYGSATPPAAAAQTAGNLKADPVFVNAETGNYSIRATSESYGRGAFLPESLTAALDRASTIPARSIIRNITDGQAVTGYQVLYEEGSVEEFYNDGRRVLDTTPPGIEIPEQPVYTRESSCELRYTVDGKDQTRTCSLQEGENTVVLSATDIFGRTSTKTVTIFLDTVAPWGSLRINRGDAETDSGTLALFIEAQDDLSPVASVRFSLDDGSSWTDWETYGANKVVEISGEGGDGLKTVLCEVEDRAGNRTVFSDSIFYTTAPALPVVVVTSPSLTDQEFYTLTYTVDGELHNETWRLRPGLNELLISGSRGSGSTYLAYEVMLRKNDPEVPEVPGVPVLGADLITLTTQNGMVLKYAGDMLAAVEQPSVYTLYLPEFDSGNNLAGGILVFQNGDRMLYQGGKPVCLEKPSGEKLIYHEDGTVAYVLGSDSKRTDFAYRSGDGGSVTGILSFEESLTARYDDQGKPLWIKRSDGTQVYYEDGFLKGYRNANGDFFRYETSISREGHDLTGYLSKIIAVRPAGFSTEIDPGLFLQNKDAFPEAWETLQNDLLERIEYDATGNIRQTVSGKGEILRLADGLPVALTGPDHRVVSIGNQISQNGDLLSISWDDGSGVVQIYNAEGALEGLRLSDGTLLRIDESSLDRIVLSDGTVLTELVWNGTSLTGFRRTSADGQVEIYRNSKVIERIGADGVRTIFIDYRNSREPESLITEDGMTYRVIRYPNGEGLTERLTELVKIDLPDGGRIEFEQGRPVRYVQSRQVRIEPYEVPELLPGKHFVSVIELPNASLRSLTVDENGYIFSGEILFRDGTQCLIENNEIVKQITASGRFLEFSDAIEFQEPGPASPPEALTVAEAAYRRYLVEKQLGFFSEGKGLHAGTGLPLDNYLLAEDQQSDYSQATLVGFWAEILAAIAAGDFETPLVSRKQAFEKLEALLAVYQEVQRQAGWNGMVAFFRIIENEQPVLDESGEPTGEVIKTYRYENLSDQYGFGDTLNLAVSLSSVLGAVKNLSLEPDMTVLRESIVARANAILTAQEAGYAAFYDPVKKRFRGAYGLNPQTGQWEFVNNYYIDRLFNEFRPGMVWLAANYPEYQPAFDGLDVTIRRYLTEEGRAIELAAPFDGGAFQMFWPLIHVDETRYPEFNVALRNFLYAQAEYAFRTGNPGLLSAGDNPGHGYEGKIGLPAAAEADDVRHSDIGSIYGTASTFGLAPHYTLQFLRNLETSFPEIVTEAGFVDALSIRTVLHTDPVTGEILPAEEPVFSSQYFGVDQASFILSLLTTSRGYLRNYLMDRGVAERFDNLYGSFLLNLNPATDSALPMPPFGENVEVLYDGGSVTPDGKTPGLVKQPSFIPNVFDSRFGEGRVFNYRQPDGAFHHSAIEFGEGGSFREMDIQEYLLLTGHTDLGRALMGGFELDVYNRADSQGAFYTPLHGYAASELIRDPLLGEVRQIAFQFLDAEHPVGLWNKYSAAPLDLDRFDFLSVPVRVGDGTPENIRLKFEFKGTGNIFLTEPLKQGWQFITIPVVRPLDGRAEMITTVIQSANGEPVAGEIYIGPLSGFKVRTTNRLDWAMMLGKSEQEIRTLIRNGIVTEAFGGGVRDAEEILENFTIDSSGKLVSGILRRADGSIQYFEDGLLSKWIFRNGRTVLYEKGIASFVIDLARGKLETGRFYYDQDLRGTIHSFNIQDNDRRRIFNTDGTLRTMIQDGNTVQMEGGRIISITTPQAILTGIEFGDDGNLIRAHAVLNDGREMDIDEFAGNRVSVGEGIWLYYRGTEITAVETLRNGRTDLVYHYDAAGRVVGVDAEFTREGEPVSMPLFEYLMLPERAAERAQLISRTLNVIAIPGSIVGEFSYPDHPQGEMIYARRADIGYDSQAYFMFQYQSTSTSHVLGMVFNHQNSPFEISDYGFLSVTLMQDPSMTWNQDFTFKIKGTGYNTLYAFSMKNLVPEYRTFWFPMAGKAGLEGEITLELVKESDGVGKEGCVYFKDVSYMSLKTFEEPLWEEQAGIRASRIRNLKIEAENLSSVGATIAAGTPLTFPGLLPYLDIPTRMIHTDTTAGANRLVTFRRFDGTRVELNGSEVTRVTLPNGIVNEYEFSENSAEISIGGPDHTSPDGSPAVSYSYGALRRIIQPDGRQYDLSYEFDSEGNEITVFTDPVSGEVRRFRGGKLLTSADPNGIVTHYLYSDEEIIGAELTYRNRVLNSTRYSYEGEETRITDERGTVWFYDADGKLIKHLTRDGYLYEYSDYSQTLPDGAVPDPGDYKNAAYAETGLRAVSLKGYQAPDGSWIIFEGDQGSEVHLASGATAVNLVFDEDQRIKAGQIQFPDGLILEIEDYVPVRGRLAEGSLFEQSLPQGTSREIVQDEEGGFLGFQCKVGDYTMTYNAAGELVRAETGAGASHYFTYTKDPGGRPTAATETALTQVAFNGVPFPKELELLAGSDQKILDSGKEIARHEGSGFLVGVYKESLNQWDVYSGSFSSQADRTGLEHFLSGVKAGESVAAIVSDPSFSGAGEGILSLFEGLGAGQVRQAASGNRKWTFFGNERLNAGEGRDAMDQASFSTVTKNVMTHSIDSDSHPTFRDAPMLLDFEMSVSRAYDSFLKEYRPLKLDRDLQRMTVYDAKNEMIYTQRLDGLSSFYEFGKVRETFDKEGNLLSSHEYGCLSGAGAVPPCQNPEDMTLSGITLVKARQDLETEVQNAAEKIAQARFDALYKLAWQDDVARLRIKESVDAGVAEINRQISSLESQRYQTVKKCRRYLFVKHCEEHTYEVPGVQSAINGLVSQRADLIRTGEEQLAAIPGAMAEKQLEIEQTTAEKMAELEAQRESVILDLLHQEMEPILTDFYRRILGRDASEEEFDDWVDRFKRTEAIDILTLETELSASPERAAREAEKALIIQGVRDFLNDYLASSAEERVLMLRELRLDAPEAVNLDSTDADAILAWLESRDLHFGQSAFLSLKKMLASSGAEVSMTMLGRESILIDILTGTIHKFTEGDLLISMFALDRTALIHARDFAAVRYSFEDLKDLYQSACGPQAPSCGVRLIAHIGEDHFVLVKNVTETEVTYEETGKGTGGADVTVTREQFLSVWNAKGNTGYLLVEASQVIPEKRLSDREAMRVRGAFFMIFFFVASIVLTAVSVAVSFFSPALGKILGYAALVAGIIGIVASLGQLVVQGLRMAFSNVTANGLFSTMARGIMNLGKVLWESVKSVGRFVLKGFQFLKESFTGGLNSLGAGITRVNDFLFTAGEAVYRDGVLIGHKFTSAQVVARQLVAAGLNYGVSRGLQGLGLSPVLGQLAGAFVGGGFLGIGNAATGFLRSGLQSFALQGVSRIATHLGLAPPIADALSLVASQSLSAFFDPALTLKTALTGIAPTVARQFALGGLELLGRSMGLDPRITALIGYPIAASIGHIVNSALSPGTFSILDSLKEALLSRETLGGFVSMGAYWLADVLDVNPLLISLGLRGIIGGIEGLTSQTSSGNAITRFFGGIAGALQESIKNVLTLGGEGATDYQKSLYLMQLVSLASKIRDGGDIFDVFEMYAVQILGRDTVESIYATGQNIEDYFRARQAAQDFTVRQLEDGTIVHEYTVGNNKFVLNEDETQILARQFGSHTESGQYKMDEQGRYVMVNGEMTFTNGTETMTLTVRDAQVVNVDMIDAQGNAVSFFGTETQPLVLVDNPNGSFTIQSGVVRNWDTGDTAYYSAGQVSAVQQTLFIDYQTDLGDTAAGSIQFVEHFDGVNVSGGYEIHMDPGFQQHLLDGDPVAMRNVAETLIDNQRITDLPDTHRSLLEELNITRHEIANQADAVVDRIFDYIKPETDSLLEDILLFPQTASVELLRSVVKGFIDAIRIGDRLDNMWDDATGAWRDINDGNLSDAGKKILSLGLNTATELFRALDIVLIGGVVKTVVGAGVTAVKTGIADLVGKLLRRQGDAAAESLLTRLFRNTGLKGEFLTEANNIDDIAEAYSRRYIGADDVTNINITRQGQEVNADYLVRRPSHEIPWDPFEDVTEKAVRDSFNVVDGDPLVRVFVPSSSNPAGKGYWITRRSVIEGKSPSEIKQILSLPQEPTHVADVVFGPTDTVFIRDGVAGSNAYGVGGGHQYEIISELKDDWFKRIREIGDVFDD